MPTALNELDVDSLLVAPAATGIRPECVLLIEDSEEAMLLVRYSLQVYGDGRYLLKWVVNLSDGLGQLSRGGGDIVLLDLGQENGSGPSTLDLVREAASEVPVLVLAGDTREETEFAPAAWGVDDYLLKDQVSGAQLVKAIGSSIRAKKSLERQKANDDGLVQRLH